ENAEISQLEFNKNQIISTDGYNNLQGYNLNENSIINTNNSGNISQTSLIASSIMYIDDNYNIKFSQINNGGILNTYKFNDNTVSQTNPQFTDKIVLNNCEIVNNNERIQNNYLIYGKPYTNGGGLSNIIIQRTNDLSYDYYYIVSAGDNVNISSSSQIYTDLYDKEFNNKDNEAQTIVFNAIPICTSSDNKNMNLNVLVPKAYTSGNYYINSDGGNNFSLKKFDNGSILPSQLATQTSTTFDYKTQNILTAGENVQRNDASQVFNYITSSDKDFSNPYLSGSGWADLKTVKFLNSNNCYVTTNMNYAGPLVVSSTGNIYKVTLPANNKYILTRSCFSQLSVEGKDLHTVSTSNLNLKNILQINDNNITKLDNVNSGILHTNDQGDITFTQLDSGDIPNNSITSNKIALKSITGDNIAESTITAANIANETITSNKIALNSITGDNIDDNTITAANIANETITGDNIANKTITAANIAESTITDGNIQNNTITAAKIATSTITGSKLYFADSLESTNWSNIIIDNNNNFIKNQNTVLTTSNNYGVLDYHGNIKALTANLITSGTMHGDRITQGTLKFNRLNTNSSRSSNFKMILVNSSNSFFSTVSSLTNGNYGVLDYQGNIVSLAANIIPNLNANKITAGTFNKDRIPGLSASKIIAGEFDPDRIPGLSASKIIAGEFDDARIPSLDAGKITTGTFVSARIPSLDAGKITSGTFGGARIANGAISGDKLNITEGNPNANFNVLVSDSNKNLKLSTSSLSNNQYGIFDYQGSLVQLNSQVLNDIGFKIILDDDNNVNDNSLISVNYVFYVDSIKTKSLQVSYINIGNYYNIDGKSFLCKYNNPNIENINSHNINVVFNDIYSNISNTYTALKNICVSNNLGESSGYNINLKSSIFIDSVEITNLTLASNLINDGFFNDKTLVFGIYTSLLNNEQYSQVIYANNSLYEYKTKNDNFMYYTLLGYFNLDLSTQSITNGITSLSISINRQYDFECTLPYHTNTLFDNFDNISNNLLSIVPLYYVNSDNNIYGLNYNLNVFSSDTEIYENISCYNMKLVLIGKNSKGDVGTVEITDYNIENSNITFTKPNNVNYYGNGMLSLTISNDNYVVNSTGNTYIKYNNDTITLENYLYEPFEKNIKFNISPITKYSNIKFTKSRDYTETDKLTNNITYKISLCNIIASIITVPGE
ncbi:MAG: hypothetical protein IJ997_01170, partial [Mycoplasmataceae bacterium]|nr:hypothetical protein [Mycoplasmataceae bacterium]